MEIRWWIAILSLLAAFNFTAALRRNPLKDPYICGRPQCDLTNQKFTYQPKTLYRYDYAMYVRSEFAGSGDNISELYVTAGVEVLFPKPCEGLLRLHTIELAERAFPEAYAENDADTESNGETENGNGDAESESTDYDTPEPEEIELHAKSEELAEDLHRNDLRFAFHDGIIGEVCAHKNEPAWVLNFKKGILSALQNSMVRFDLDYNTTETDVSGTCDVVYTLLGSKGTALQIEKSKDIASCKHRYKTESFLQTTPYEFRQNYAAWPILKSNSYCNISIDHNVYKGVSCFERHQLVPFSNERTGAVTESRIKLTLTDEEVYESHGQDDEPILIETRSPLYFDHTPSRRPTTGEIKASRELLKKMCELGYPDIRREFSDVFTTFLSTAKALSYVALQQLLARAASICPQGNGKNHVLDSLPFIGSTASVLVMRDEIIRESVSTKIAHEWMASLSFLPRPDEEMIDAMLTLLEYGKSKNDADYTLGSSALVHTFCNQNSECGNNKHVQKIVRYLEADLLDNINAQPNVNAMSPRTFDRIIVVLKGIGNIGVINHDFSTELKALVENTALPVEIRVQAVIAYRRFDCFATRNYFLDVYQDFRMQSEVRVAAYLQTMRCPDYLSIKIIKHVLTNEEVNQVGSFVWSHLGNVAKSASPVRVEAQGLLVDGDLGTKFKLDIRKFSRNFERSLFFDEYNFGLNSDTNLIFGTDSYLPKSLSMNFTADLFGESVNILELTGRMEGFENIVESIFGPKGPLNTEQFKKKFAVFTKFFRETATQLEDDDINYEKLNMKVKRDIESPESHDLLSIDDDNDDSINSDGFEEDLEEDTNQSVHGVSVQHSEIERIKRNAKSDLANSVNNFGYKINTNYDKPRASLGVKVFGNDLKYFTVDGFAEVFGAIKSLNPIDYVKDVLSGREITYAKSGVFLDASYTIPMTSGLPLSIKVLGASSVDLRMSGLLKSPEFIEQKSLDIEGKLKPSISIDMLATMESDFFHVSTGLRVKSNLYSSSSIEAKLKVKGTKLVSLQFSLPQDRNEIFSAKSEMLVVKNAKDIPQKGIAHRYENSTCTWPVIDRAVGLKMCAKYSLPDVSNATTTYPSLVFSGPIDVNVYLDKADLTAKTFVFEYRWDTSAVGSRISFVFETPGSVIPRIFTGNITNDIESHNVSMSFRNGERSHSAVGSYRYTPEMKSVELYLDINGQKNLALEMGLNRTELKYGFMYYPSFLLSVNNERIAGLSGTVKFTEKKSVIQYDVALIFETKRLQARLNGFASKTEASYSTKMNLDYRFNDNKQETVEIEGELANRSQKSRIEYQGAFKHKSTAYPKLNFASNMKFLSALGHVEAKLDLNNSPTLDNPQHTLTTRFVFARYHSQENGRTTAFIEVTRPSTNTNLKFMIKHEEKFKTGPEHNVLFVVRYATKKEMSAVISVMLPRGPLFAIDAALNVTIPAFDPGTMRLQIFEKTTKEYKVDFRGTWFSGNTIAVKGVYQDRSSIIKTFYHLKLVAQSPSFDETNIDLRYSSDEYDLVFDCQIDYGHQPFGAIVKYSTQTPHETVSYVEIKWKERLYWVSANMNSMQPKQLLVEVHIDKLRDIHLILRGLSNELKKQAGVEVKWDANRDPTQRLALSVEFNTPLPKVYNGEFIVAYPDRTLSGTFDLNNAGPEHKGAARLGWSANEALDFKFNGGTNFVDVKEVWLSAKLDTPFDGWKNNAIKSGIFYQNNLLLVNGTVLWAETQKLAINFKGDYEINDPLFACEIHLGLNSTVQDVPTVSGQLKHRHDSKRIDTDIAIKHTALNETPHLFSIRSGWQFDISDAYRNISGSVALRSPFEGYKSGALVTKFSLSAKKELKGAADLDLEEKTFTLSVEGHIKKLTENMLVLNITTPLDKFRLIEGRFGLNEREKHLVAEIRAPTGSVGIEVLFAVVTSAEFDVKFNLATPIEAFEKVLVIAKMKPETIDFRGGWNKVVLGFVGVWRVENFTDFEYSYKVYTPLENFEANGVVAKFIKREEFDLELSFKLAQYKLGVKMMAKPKPKLMRQLGLQRTHSLINDLFDDSFKNQQSVEVEPDSEEYEEDWDALLNFMAVMELDAIVWPTIKGNLDVEEVDDTFYSFGTLILPQGIVELRDQFYFPDYLNMKNILNIHTPFGYMKEIRSFYECKLRFGRKFILGLEVNVLNHTNWVDAGFSYNYLTQTDASELTTYDVSLKLKTPLGKVPKIHLKALLELEENTYRGNVSASTLETEIALGGSIESEENFVEASVSMSLQTSVIPQYAFRAFFKKDLSETENIFDGGFELQDNNTNNNMRFEAVWHPSGPHFLSARGKFHTNILPLKLVEGSVLVSRSPHPTAALEVSCTTAAGVTEFRSRIVRQRETVTAELVTPLEQFRNVSMHATLAPVPGDNAGSYELLGNLYRNKEVYHIDGIVKIKNDIPVQVNLSMQPLTGGAKGEIVFTLKEMGADYGRTFQARIARQNRYAQIGGGIGIQSATDWSFVLSLTSSEPEIGQINLNASISPPANGSPVIGVFEAETPWSELGLDQVKILVEASVKPHSGELRGTYQLPALKGDGSCLWSWLLMENMEINIRNGAQRTGFDMRVLQLGAKYVDPSKNKQHLVLGGNINVDNLWRLETNGSFIILSSNDMSTNFAFRLPEPIGDVHRLLGRYRGNLVANSPNMEFSYELKYEADEARKRFASRGEFRNVTDLQGLMRVEWGPDLRMEAVETNMQMVRHGNRRELSARIATPLHLEDTLKAVGSYEQKDIYHMLAGTLSIPASNQIADADVAFAGLTNTKGMVNCSTPFLNITWLRADFDLSTIGGESIRYIKATWENNSAFVDSKSTFTSHNLDRDLQGTITLEVPLTTRHNVNVVYGLKERPLLKTGHATVEYNKRNVLNSQYTCKSEERAGHEKDIVDITLENDLKPIGIHYVHLHELENGDKMDYDMKHVELFELKRSKEFNITGELHVTTTMSGQKYKIVAVHPNRTVILTSDYDYEDNISKHNSKLELAPTVWISYDWKVENRTTVDNESQIFSVELSYPKRSLFCEGWFSVTEDTFDSDLALKWTKNSEEVFTSPAPPRIMRAAFKWRNEPLEGLDKENQTGIFLLRHPSFNKDVTLKGTYYRSATDLLKATVHVDYCDEPDHLLVLSANIRDLTEEVGYRNYSFEILGNQEISELNLDLRGSIGGRSKYYEITSEGSYKRGYLPLQTGFLNGFINLVDKEINYHKESSYKTVKLWAKARGLYPLYTVNGTLEDSPDLNSTGRFFINIDDKYIRVEVNMTPDASQNMQIIGAVPDARSAYFDVWRDYEDIRVVDISSYLRMNHSRLVTSQVIWRPKIKAELKASARKMASSFYDSLSEGIDFWIKTLYTESMDTMNDVWQNAKPFTQDFLDDVGGLRVIENDMEEFRVFLNASYQANDFYIRSVVNFTLTIIDELAIRNHIESVPKILNEIWQVMGESGQALRRSILWLIDTIKMSYKKAVEMIGRILHGESLEHISTMLEKGVEKYDKFIKDLHLSLIKYVEHLWTRMIEAVTSYWKRMLQNIEPSIIKFAHYVETMMWNISKELFDFLYKRTNELAESPYFNQVSNFTQDLDRLYKDLMANDAITNFKKYTVLAWRFLKEQYFKVVPFGKELHDLIDELYDEIKTLQELESVKFVIQRINDIQAQIEWVADELQVEKRVHQLWALLRNKMMRFAQTALQADNRYREAKTKFIFDPEAGILELEQKLPMSWHAFNETPKFEEIPEYKFIHDVQNFFTGSNTTLWTLYYELKPFSDPNMWLPPFKAHALLIGSRHFMTFDRNFVSVNMKYKLVEDDRKLNQCSYLLAHDFLDGNFTLILEPSIIKQNDELILGRKLSMLAENELFDIDVVGDAVRIGRNLTTALPAQIGDTVIYRDADVLTIESSRGFSLVCNLQFDLCTFDLSGWYYAKTAGILGTMNNEINDDFRTASNEIAATSESFYDSWALRGCRQSDEDEQMPAVTMETRKLCESFFRSKTSYFATCFSLIDTQPFMKMCLEMGANDLMKLVDPSASRQKGACTAALAYIEACEIEKTPLRIPDICVRCNLINGSSVPEGTFVNMANSEVPQTTDVVFLIEAKECNENITTSKNMLSIVGALHKELTDVHLTKNRYAVIAFGGASPFDAPRSIVINNQVFTDHFNLAPYFEHIKAGHGTNKDIFQAISIASKLIFRPGASKTFILVPCSECFASDMRLDYSSLLQLLLENGINLHILMDQDLTFDKARGNRMFFGMDRNLAYTKKDLTDLKGDADLRKQVHLPKATLGLCTPLAIETNGTVFSARKLRPEKKNPVKKFATVFAKRVAQTATPKTCQVCECTGHNTGVAYMTCSPCSYNSMDLDYGIEDAMLNMMHDLNWDWDDEVEIE